MTVIPRALTETPGTNLFDQGRHMYDIDQWEHFCAKYPGFFRTVIEDQIRIQERCVGRDFWKAIQDRTLQWASSSLLSKAPTARDYIDQV